jgi:hypothetical protein
VVLTYDGAFLARSPGTRLFPVKVTAAPDGRRTPGSAFEVDTALDERRAKIRVL